MTKRAAQGRRRAWRSPLTLRILALNVLVLAIPVLGLLHLEQYRDSLIESELDALRTQARAFSATLAGSAVVVTQAGEEKLLPEATRHAMRALLPDSRVRARLFAPDGGLMADSFVLMGPSGQVEVEELPPPRSRGPISRMIDRAYAWLLELLPQRDELPFYTETLVQDASQYSEVEAALGGETQAAVRRHKGGGLVLTVAAPVQRYRQVLGALMLSADGRQVEAAVRDRRFDILVVFALALGVTVLLSIYLARTIARPIQRLAEAADQVRRAHGRRQVEIPDLSRRGDEVGDLSAALKEMTEALWDRLDAIESFAADVAHEIKNPLTSVRSAVETAARVDDPAQQKRLMAIILDDVQRLDRLISDISAASRLDAELSRAESEPVDLARLLHALVEIQRAAFEEHGGPRFTLDLPDGAEDSGLLVVQGLEGRLGQVFRNLLANAATFSPAEGAVRVAARREGDSVVVTVDDDGPGIPEGKLEAIFNRFYTERPKDEKFGAHSGLGLSISKQIVEAHGGAIVAENRRGDQGEVAGARFTVRLPSGGGWG